jgi:superfamily II DNA or RNA helicase
MKFVRRDPGAAYLDNWLWLPKTRLSELQVRSAFLYPNPRSTEPVLAFHEERHHWRIPRNFMTPEALATLPYPVYDVRFRSFPRVQFRSRVVLDSKEPSKDYQRRGSAALLAVRDGILCLRCGAGKTVVALHSAAQLGVPFLILINDKGLARQWRNEIEWALGLSKDDIGQCFDNKFDWHHPVTIASVQTISQRAADGRLPPEMAHHFGLVIPDEAHVMGAPKFSTAVPPFHGRRWGLSATPVREDGFDSLLRYVMGPVVYTYLEPDLRPKVIFRRLGTRVNFSKQEVFDATHDVGGELHRGMLYAHFASLADRTELLVEDIRASIDQGRQVLVLSHSRDMCDQLAGYFPEGGVTHGGITNLDEHDRVVRDCNPVIAIMQRGKQALNKPSLDTVYLCEPATKKSVLQQIFGRALRAHAGKKKPVIVIVEDINIKLCARMCGKIRLQLNRWPANKGGRIEYTILKPR